VPQTYGMYMPDAIEWFTVGGNTYLLTANEGDSKDWPPFFSEDTRVATVVTQRASQISPSLLAVNYQNNSRLARMKVSFSDVDANGNYSQWQNYGTRSMSVFQVTDAGVTLVADTGAQFENYFRALYGYPYFNCDEGNSANPTQTFDVRSDDKGPEPETVRVGMLGGELFGFCSCERTGGVFMYSLTNPSAPAYHSFFNNRNFTELNPLLAGDLSPEGMVFIPKTDSPTGDAMLLVTGTFSGTVSAYFIRCTGSDCPADSAAHTLGGLSSAMLMLIMLACLLLTRL